MSRQERFCFGGYWLAREPKSPYWQRCWYDPAARKVRRRSLATSDVEDAKARLAAFVLENPEAPADDPQETLLIVALKAYWEGHSDFKTRPSDARRAGELLLDYLGNKACLGDLTRARQDAFMRWLVTKHDHSVATISKYLSFINAALRRAAEPQVVTGPDGREVERRLITLAPKIYYQTAHIAQVVDKPEPEPRDWQPTLEQLGAFIDAIRSEHVFRYTLLALNTWARPEAICDIDPSRQVDRQHRLLNLNPPGRRQNKKYRPVIPITDCLWGWLEVWPKEGRLVAIERKAENGEDARIEPVASIRNAFELTRERAKVAEMTRYSLHHLLGTQARASRNPRVPPEQKDLWMGHKRLKSGTSEWYERFDPDFLEDARNFTDGFMERLQKHCQRSLFAPANPSDYRPLVCHKPRKKEP